MLNPIDARLQQIISLWVDGNPASLGRIPALCDEIEELVSSSECKGDHDRNLARRAACLSAKAEQRLAACLEIQSRTGSYSMQGALELLPRVVTAGWEG
jgi:hypothetical protein